MKVCAHISILKSLSSAAILLVRPTAHATHPALAGPSRHPWDLWAPEHAAMRLPDCACAQTGLRRGTATLTLGSKARLLVLIAAILGFGVLSSARAMEPELLYYFGLGPSGTNGPLVQGGDGNFYGTTSVGGVYGTTSVGSGGGTVFKVTTNGVLTTLADFNQGWGGLVLGHDGNFYGIGSTSASGDQPMLVKVTTNGVATTVSASLRDPNGGYPLGLVLGSDGNFYGTTSCCAGGGTVFKVTTNGVLTTLADFANGADPLGSWSWEETAICTARPREAVAAVMGQCSR